MEAQRRFNRVRLACALAWLAVSSFAWASEYRGVVTFGALPVPGATVTAKQGTKQFTAITDQMGSYAFVDLPDGSWTIRIEMTAFATVEQAVTIAPSMPTAAWELKMLSLDAIRATLKPVPGMLTSVQQAAPAMPKPEAAKGEAAVAQESAPPPPSENAQQANDGLLINGSVNNAATSRFTTAPAFGNTRNGKALYTGGLGMTLDNSALDASPYSLTGAPTQKASYNRLTGVFTIGGPIRIPSLLRNGPTFTLVYYFVRNRNDAIQAAIVPTLAERAGDFSQTIYNPATGLPYAGNVVPIGGQAQALLALYPLPNYTGSNTYNYQTSIDSDTHVDAVQLRMNRGIGHKDQAYGDFNVQTSRTSTPNIFGFVDKTDAIGINTGVSWMHSFGHGFRSTLGYRFSRQSTFVRPYWQDRANVSGQAGIAGNDQDAMDWGPPTLNFTSSGIASLTDAQSSFNRSQSDQLSLSVQWNRRAHNYTFGGDYTRRDFNYLSQRNPRGSFTFTGAASAGASGTACQSCDFADFLAGAPDTSTISFGNADKYLRQALYDAFATDDWRVTPQFTINLGVRWEYGAPITEIKNRLVNLDVAGGFAKVAPVVATNAVGSLTGQQYPASLVRPDRADVEPRIGLSWRPIPGSSLVVRAGYGVYADSSVYQTMALQLAEQTPLATSFDVNRTQCAITLAAGFNCASAPTFAVDPNFRVGYAQSWQVSVQRDLPWSMQVTGTYLGVKGTRGNQEFLPNTYPAGSAQGASGPAGFIYLDSNGNSTRESGQIQLRRRLHNGLQASAQYTYSKSLDDDSALGGQGAVATGLSTSTGGAASSFSIAQNWLNLSGERGLSTFDQRHLLNVQMQYTTGMGLGGRSLMTGWRGALYKEWTAQTTIAVASGLPETPIYPETVPGTGFTGVIRPSVTGAPVHVTGGGLFLNQAAFMAPATGHWGDARRDSITGPNQFTMNSSLGRTFRLKDRYNLDLRFDATNVLNHVTYTGWNTTWTPGSTQFGLPVAANAMRSIQTTLRLRF